MSTLLEQWNYGTRLEPSQEPWMATQDAAPFGPNQTILAGQAIAMKTSDKKLYAYTSATAPATPAAPAGVPVAGGTLAAGAYLAKVNARFGTGNTAASAESAAATTAGGNLSITWSWAAVANATSYDLYRTAAGGSANSEVFLVNVPASASPSFTDTGAISPGTATPPSASAAPSDGTQTCVGLSGESFVTDAAGLAYARFSTTAGSPAPAVAGTRTSPQSTMYFWKRGTFDPSLLTAFDAAAQTALGARTLPNGMILIP